MSNFAIRTPRFSTLNRQSGFTLIEIMVVVAVIGILAALSYPSYTEYVRAAKRADMQRALSEADQFMRRYYSARDSFEDAELPGGLKQSPRESAVIAYTIDLVDEDGEVVDENPSATTYTLRATRSDGMVGDRCGDLSVTHTGARSIANNREGTTLAECFKGS